MSFWDNVKPWVSKLAPMLGTALGGPLGGVAGALIGDALGIKDATPESITAAIKTGSLTGDQILALKKAEQDFMAKMAELEINSVKDLEELAYKDRDSARRREIEVGDWTPRIIAYSVVIVWASMNGFLLWAALNGKSLAGDMNGVIQRILGTLDAALTLALSFYYGTSAGSRVKDEMLYRSSPKV